MKIVSSIVSRYQCVLTLFILVTLATSSTIGAQQTDQSSAPNADTQQAAKSGNSTSYSNEPEGFRLTDYRTPVPKTLTGATTLSTSQMEDLLANTQLPSPLLIDVFPKTEKPESWPQNQLWLPEPHQSIPTAHWLAEVGFGTINTAIESAYKEFLQLATNNNLAYPIVLFCRKNCWISWNAAKRLVQYGYQQVYWYPDGMDGWLENLNDTEVTKPEQLVQP